MAGLTTDDKTKTTAARRCDGKEDETMKQRQFLLIYRFTNNMGKAKGDPLNIAFNFKGDLANARIRARNHCEFMNYRYINCRPFIVDLDEREKLREQSFEDDD